MTEKDILYVNIKLTVSNIENKEYHCNEELCGKQFSSEHSLKKHLIIIHHNISSSVEKSKKIIYKFHCPIDDCRKGKKSKKDFFITRKHLVQHYSKVHNSEKFQCEENGCDRKFSTILLRNLHMKNCGKTWICSICDCVYNSNEALLTHAKRKNHYDSTTLKTKQPGSKVQIIGSTEAGLQIDSPVKRNVATTTSGLCLWNTTEKPSTASKYISVFTSTSEEWKLIKMDQTEEYPAMNSKTASVFTSTNQPISSTTSTSECKSTTTDDIYEKYEAITSSTTLLSTPKAIKDSSTCTTADIFTKEDSLSSSSSNNKKKNVNWSMNEDFEDSLNLFDNNLKMEFYSAETQTDFVNLFNNNYTQTTFGDFDDFAKFDNQTQTNWEEFNP